MVLWWNYFRFRFTNKLFAYRLCKKLQLPSQSSNISVQGIGDGCQCTTTRINLHLKSEVTAFSIRVEALALPGIIFLQPLREFDESTWEILKNLQLVDPLFCKPDRVDLLLGVECYYQFLSIGQVKLGANLPIL